jgi:hypothetical protein
MLDLRVRSIRVRGHDESIAASTDPVIAGSARARSLGAIPGRRAVNAFMGGAVRDGENPRTAAGVTGPAGYEVVLSDGTVMSFTVNRTVTMQ